MVEIKNINKTVCRIGPATHDMLIEFHIYSKEHCFMWIFCGFFEEEKMHYFNFECNFCDKSTVQVNDTRNLNPSRIT